MDSVGRYSPVSPQCLALQPVDVTVTASPKRLLELHTTEKTESKRLIFEYRLACARTRPGSASTTIAADNTGSFVTAVSAAHSLYARPVSNHGQLFAFMSTKLIFA